MTTLRWQGLSHGGHLCKGSHGISHFLSCGMEGILLSVTRVVRRRRGRVCKKRSWIAGSQSYGGRYLTCPSTAYCRWEVEYHTTTAFSCTSSSWPLDNPLSKCWICFRPPSLLNLKLAESAWPPCLVLYIFPARGAPTFAEH